MDTTRRTVVRVAHTGPALAEACPPCVPEPRAPARMCCTPSAALLCNLLLHSVCSFVRVFL